MKASTWSASHELKLTDDKYISKGHSIAVKRHTTVAFPMHFHTYFELEIVLEGSATQTLNGESYELSRGDVYLITPTDYHRVRSHGGPLSLWNIVFEEHALRDACLAAAWEGLPPTRLCEEQLGRIDRLCEILCEECVQDGPRCDGILLESLLSMILRSRPSRHPSPTGEHRGEMDKACHYLQTHFREAPTLSDIAAHVGFHPAYFSEQFKKHTGMRYMDRLNELRVGYAKHLLSQGLSVSEACFGAGFGSLSNFQYSFKRSTGLSPREYKKECK